ncbi:hypothetical protein Indivirus_2_75 [Indivirus ILV1]|uniref:SWIB/MDM2 domain protein n=1 Tax=Indivirus ILV1 TaxID=1977633 RepID=A0A1V0SDA5_9VIRU|nr:hypothetical protein Indivirus_2_75 [Indivirus ILV1]
MANAIIQTIDKLYGSRCKHIDKWSHVQNYSCIAISTHIMSALNKNIALPINEIHKFYDYIVRSCNYYNSDTCLKIDMSQKIPLLKKLFSLYPPSAPLLIKFLLYEKCDECIDSIPSDILDTDPYIYAIIEARLKYTALSPSFENDMVLVNILLNKIQINTDRLKELVRCRSYNLATRIAAIIDKTNIPLTNEILNEACKALPYSKAIISSLVSRGVSLNSDNLLSACHSADAKSLNYIINTGKITITSSHLKEIIQSARYHLEFDRYKIKNIKNAININDNMFLCRVDGYSEEKLEVLIKNGYNITYDDVIFSIKYKKEIPGIDRFNIKLDKKLLELCWDVDFYPKTYKFDCISQNQMYLQELCNTRKTSEIKSLLKNDSSLIIDRKCMENVCSFAKNSMYDFLIGKGGVPTIKCIKNVGKMIKNNALLLQVIDDFEKANTLEILEYKTRISELEKKISELENSGVPIKKQDPIDIKVKKKKVVIIDDIKNDKSKEKLSVPPSSYIMLPIDDSQIQKIQQEHREKKIPTEKMIKLLKINPKIKINYSKVREDLISKIRDDGWIDKNNKDRINLPVDVKKLLSLKDKNDIIQFSDIDKLVCLLY